MPNPIPRDGTEKSYWLQALQAGHWRNVEQIADAGAAMIRTGTAAEDTVFDAVRLLEARFDQQKGRTEFFEVVTIDIAGAHFAGHQGNAQPDHVRMDLLGTIAPLLPSAEERTVPHAALRASQSVQSNEQARTDSGAMDREDAAPLTAGRDDARFDRLGNDLMPLKRPMSPSHLTQGHLTQGHLPQRHTRHGMPRRHGMRSRLMAGVMAGAFVAGVAVSAMAPEQSEELAAALFDRIGIDAGGRAATLAQAPEPTGAQADTKAAPKSDTKSGNESWPVAWGRHDDVAPAPASIIDTAETSTTPAPKTNAIVAAATGLDLEAEHRQPAENMLAASLAGIAGPAASTPQPSADRTVATAVTPPAPMTPEQAYAMQVSLPVPSEQYQAPTGPSSAETVQVAENADDGLHLADQGPNDGLGQGAFTTAVAGDASQLETAVFPRPQRKPDAIKERAAYRAALAEAIEQGTADDLLNLIYRPAEVVEVASLSDSAIAPVRNDLTSLLDFALLQGKPDHAAALAAEGVRPSTGILTLLRQSADRASLKRIAPIVRQVGIDPNRVSESGMTPLMQAAYIGDGRGVDALLTLGADPAFETGEGLRAADFAARAEHVDVQEKLVLATDQALYTPLMFGLTWSDTVETVKDRSNVCKQVGEGFIACSLKAQSWLDDTAAVIAQFDTRNGNRLVAIQVDSHLYSDADEAEVGFKKAAGLIAKVVPPDQFGFPVRDIPSDRPVFESLTPAVGTGQYFQYWPDDNLKRPVYVHMKMIGYKGDRGFHRIVIGNPFRVG
jgi:hypothetical protein